MPKASKTGVRECVWCGNPALHEFTCRDCDLRRCVFASRMVAPIMAAAGPQPITEESLHSWRAHIAFHSFELADAMMGERRTRL